LFLFVLTVLISGSCSADISIKPKRNYLQIKDTIVKKDSSLLITMGKTFIFSDIGCLYLKKNAVGKIKGYYEYGNFKNENYCNTYFEVSNENKEGWRSILYGTYDELNNSYEFDDTTYLQSGDIKFSESIILMKEGGGTCSRFVPFFETLELPFVETTSDNFVIVIKNKPIIYNENLSLAKNIQFYVGMMIRSTGEMNEYFKFKINGINYLVKKEDCKLWE